MSYWQLDVLFHFSHRHLLVNICEYFAFNETSCVYASLLLYLRVRLRKVVLFSSSYALTEMLRKCCGSFFDLLALKIL